MQQIREKVQVWDPLVRIFHWLLVACFGIAYILEDEFINLHLLAGSIVLGLVLFRLIWGFVGTQHVRFAGFLPSWPAIRAHLHDLVRLRPSFHYGHTPVGSVMIFLLLVCLMLLTASGVALYGLEGGGGIPAAMVDAMPRGFDMFIRDAHALIADFLAFLIIVHVGGVILESLLQGQNLVIAMITGRKRAARKEEV